ncbi:MAG: hypothetical protein ABFC56_06815 [Clostridiaceae bacterium]
MVVPAVERPVVVMEVMVVELVEEPDKEQQRENLEKQAQLFMQAEVAAAALTVMVVPAVQVAAALVDGLRMVQMQIPVLPARTIWAAVAVAVVPVQQKAALVLLAAPVSVSSATSEHKEENT